MILSMHFLTSSPFLEAFDLEISATPHVRPLGGQASESGGIE